MGAVNVSISHDKDFVVPHLVDVKFIANSRAQCRHNRHQLVVAVNAVGAGFFHVQHLAPQRQDCLDVGITPLLGRAASRVTLDDEDFGLGGVILVAVCQFARHTVAFQRTLAAHQVAGLFGCGTGAGCLGHLFKHSLGNSRVFFQKFAELVVHNVGNQRLDVGVAQLGFGLALKLRFLQLDGNNGDHAFAHIAALPVFILLLQVALGTAKFVKHAGQRGFQAFLVGAALRGVHVVGKRKDQLVVAVAVLQSNFGHSAVGFAFHIDDLRVQRGQVALFMQILHKAAHAALIAHGFLRRYTVVFLNAFGALIRQGNAHTGVQEAFFPQALEQDLIIVFGGFGEHFRVWLKSNGGTRRCRHTDLFQVSIRFSTLETLLVLGAVTAHMHNQPFAQRVYNAGADAVQTASHFVAGILAAKLAAGMQHGIHDRDSRDAQFGLDIHRDTAAVITDFNDIARLDGHFNMGAVPGQSFIDGVIHDFINQMMQTGRACGTDIHAGALAHSFQPFQDLDLRAAVLMVGRRFAVGFGDDFF